MNAPAFLPETTIRAAGPTDRDAIAAFVSAHPDATPFHRREWMAATVRGCGVRDRTLVAERRGRIAGVLPLGEVRSRLFGNALVSAPFAVGGGVLGEGDFAPATLDLARRLGCGTVEWRGGAAPAGWGVDEATYLGFARDLAGDDDAELPAIPRKQRAEVRKALAAEAAGELTMVTGGAELAEEHYRIYANSVRNLGTPVFPRALFRAVLEGMDADVLTVRHRGRAVASVLSLYWRGTVMPYWGGGIAEARALRANDLMYFALMRHARARGCNRFDFGRSKAGTGPAAFKKNWGFAGAPLAYARWSDGPAREVNPLDPRYAAKIAAWRRLPLPVANAIGPWISRGLG